MCSLQTNAQKIVLLPINFVRLFTDPLADRLIHVTTQQAEIVQSPTAKSRLLGFINRVGFTSKPKETAYQRLSSQVVAHASSVRSSLAAYLTNSLNAVQTQWYRMAVGDSNVDRTLCIALGYFVVIAGAGFYLQYTQNRPAREAGAAIRDHIKHNFTMVKVSAITSSLVCYCIISPRADTADVFPTLRPQCSFSSKSLSSQQCVVCYSIYLPFL